MWLKLYYPIVSSDSGRIHEFSFVHMKNAFFSITFSVDPFLIITHARFSQF